MYPYCSTARAHVANTLFTNQPLLLLQCVQKKKIPLMMAAQSNYTVLVDMLVRHQRLEQLSVDPRLNFPYSQDLVPDVDQLGGHSNAGFAAAQEEALGGELMEGERELTLEAFKMEAFGDVRKMRDTRVAELELSTAERLRELVAATNYIYKAKLKEAAKNAHVTQQIMNALSVFGFQGDKQKENQADEDAAAEAAEIDRQVARAAPPQGATPAAEAPGTESPLHYVAAAETGEQNVPVELTAEEAAEPVEEEAFDLPRNVWPSKPPPRKTLEAAMTNEEAYAFSAEIKANIGNLEEAAIEHMNLISTSREQRLLREEVQYKLQEREPLDEVLDLVAGAGDKSGLRIHVVESKTAGEGSAGARIDKYLKELREERMNEANKMARQS